MANKESTPILPVPGKKNILITSALPYVNNVPHLGNIVGSVLSADVFARYSKGRGNPTLFICGTDEYGTATETKALAEGVTVQELCAKFRDLHKQIYDWFEIAFDKWGQTSTQHQTEITQNIFTKLHQNGFLREETTTQPYCESHNAFLADRFVEGECPLCGYNDARGDQCDSCGKLLDPLELKNPKCKVDGATPVPRQTTHVYLELDKLQAEEEKWFSKSVETGQWSENGVKITQNWLNEGLKPRAITRDLKWGTPIPSWLKGYENKVIYVWFDATIGYISITANYTSEWEKWWRNPKDVTLYQFMGKDNVPFHSVVFPASLIGTREEWTLVNGISTTEYLNYEGGKFSKSRNLGVFGDTAKLTGVPPDVWRYYLLSHRPETSDSEFEWSSFIVNGNDTLLKNLGNFTNRILKFVAANYSSTIPEFSTTKSLSDTNPPFDASTTIKEVNTYLKIYNTDMTAMKLRAGLASVMHISSIGNKLLQENRLDNRLKAEQPELCDNVVGLAVNIVHLIGCIAAPFLPATSAGIFTQLGIDEPAIQGEHHVSYATRPAIPDTFDASHVKPGQKIGKPSYLFSPIKPEKEAEWRKLFGAAEPSEEEKKKAEKKKAAKEKKAAKKVAAREEGKIGGKVGSVEQEQKSAAEKEVDGLAAAGLDESGKPVDGIKNLSLNDK